MKSVRNILIIVLLFTLQLVSVAQVIVPYVKIESGKGIQFTSPDSLFTLTLNGRIQSMFEAKRDITNETSGADFILRRCRLNFQGTAFDPKFAYRIQIGFAHGDITSGNSEALNNLILRDAMLFYSANKWLRIGFGQTKLPGNRQRQVSSANLQLVERSIANNNFTLDRDKGLWLYGKFHINKSVLKPTISISSGEGRIASNKNGKLCFSSRMEFLPFGEFSKNGDYIEADLEKEQKPKLAIALAYSFNDSASRTMGQLGDYLYNGQTAQIQYYGVDLSFKYKGFSLTSEMYARNSDKGIITNNKEMTLSNYVISGTNFLLQSGYFVSKRDEIAVRYAHIAPDDKVASIMKTQSEYVLGYSHYFSKNNLKLQTDITYLENGANNSLIYRFSGVVAF